VVRDRLVGPDACERKWHRISRLSEMWAISNSCAGDNSTFRPYEAARVGRSFDRVRMTVSDFLGISYANIRVRNTGRLPDSKLLEELEASCWPDHITIDKKRCTIGAWR